MKIQNADEMVAEYGDQAYHKAVEFVVVATHLGDVEGQKHFAAIARELLARCYHKHPKVQQEE
jgi:hypothetical protein